MRKWLMVIGGGLLALVIIFSGISVLSAQLQKRHEKQIATSFIQNILSDRSQASYDMFSSQAQSTQSKDDWSTLVEKLSSFFKGKTPQLQAFTGSPTSAITTYAISGKDGNYIMSVTLTKTKAGWQVTTFNSMLKAG